MNSRLRRYLEANGLRHEATEEEAQAFLLGLRGQVCTTANLLNYNENDTAARTACDQALRSMGVDPADPTQMLAPEPATPAGDGASLTADLPGERTNQGLTSDQLTQLYQMADMSGADPQFVRNLSTEAGMTLAIASQRLHAEHVERTRAEVQPEHLEDQGRSPIAAQSAPAGHVHATYTGQNSRSLAFNFLQARGHNLESGTVDLDEYGAPEMAPQFDDARQADADLGRRLGALDSAEFIRQLLLLDGIRCGPSKNALLGALNGRAMASTLNFTGTFTQIAGARALTAFRDARDTTRLWTKAGTNPDFKQNLRNRLEKGGRLTRHARGGTADHDSYGDTHEYVKVNRFTKQIVVDEMDIIDDSLGQLLMDLPVEFGAAAARTRPHLVYSILLGNPNLKDGNPLFRTEAGNLIYNSPLNKDNLQKAVSAMLRQQENGVDIDLEPRYLAVPGDEIHNARELIRSQTVVASGGAEATRFPSYNALSDDNLIPFTDSRLQNGATDPWTDTRHAGSATDWYLMAEPQSGHTVEVTGLLGRPDTPVIRTYQLVQGQWGQGIDVLFDIGASPLARQGLLKAVAGAAP